MISTPREKRPRLYRLRWRFEYSDGKPPRYGIWDFTDGDRVAELSAWRANAENCLFAVVEAECVYSHETTRVIECPGADFVNFAWVGAQAINVDGSGNIPLMIIGFQIVTRDQKVTAFRDGRTHIEARSEEEKSIHLATFGR